MKQLRKIFLFSAGFLLMFGVCLSVWQFQRADAQNKPLSYPEIFTALSSTVPNKSFQNKTELINFLIAQIKSRGVDKPLTKDREDDLRQAGATEELIAAIKANSPPLPTPIPTSTPTPTPKPTPIPTPTPTPKPTPLISADGKQMQNLLGIEFVRVSAGSFRMGSDKAENEKPIHKVDFANGFWMGKYEVTIGEWKAVMGDIPPDLKTADAKFQESDIQPVVYVSWEDAKAFITKLNATDDGYEYRLPSEAEWEFVARAGTATEFSFGDRLGSNQANFDGNFPYGNAAKGKFLGKTSNVGSYQPNAWGFFDMHGNVWEWVEDIYSSNYDFSGVPTDGSANLTVGNSNLRILRGGSWSGNGFNCRSAIRNRLAPSYRSNLIGFRLVGNAK